MSTSSGTSASVSCDGIESRARAASSRASADGPAREVRGAAPVDLLTKRAAALCMRVEQRRRVDAQPDDRRHQLGIIIASSRPVEVAGMCSFSGLSSGLKRMRWIAHSRYAAAKITPVVATMVKTGACGTRRCSTRNSPDEAVRARERRCCSANGRWSASPRTSARRGRCRQSPRSAACAAARRACRREGTAPPVEMPWLIITISAPWTLCSVSAKMPSITKPRWLTDE